MRIAQIAPCWFPVPPQGYGGIESMVASVADGLVERGHDVTLFASGGSGTQAQVVSYHEEAPGIAKSAEDPFMELPHVLNAYARAGEFDVIHDHTFPLGPSVGAHLGGQPPIIHTVHGPPDHPSLRPLYQLLNGRIRLVAIGEHQRQATPELEYAATVHNGISVHRYPYQESGGDYLLFVGRICEEKGPHLAAEVARRLGRRLIMAGKMQEPPEREFFEAEVKPRLDGNMEFVGEIEEQEKQSLYANAFCTLMPIQWAEPFGLVMVESLACGTPVVALRAGAAAEIVDDGVTGYVVDDVDAMVEAVGRVDSLDRRACREAVEKRFSTEAMLDGYEEVYAQFTG